MGATGFVYDDSQLIPVIKVDPSQLPSRRSASVPFCQYGAQQCSVQPIVTVSDGKAASKRNPTPPDSSKPQGQPPPTPTPPPPLRELALTPVQCWWWGVRPDRPVQRGRPRRGPSSTRSTPSRPLAPDLVRPSLALVLVVLVQRVSCVAFRGWIT